MVIESAVRYLGGFYMGRRGNSIVGAVFIVLGALFLLKNLNLFSFSLSTFWPFFVIIPGLAFHYAYFSGSRNDPGLLVPGGILLVSGVTFQISELFGAWSIMWPFIIMSVAVGLFELYVFGNREKGLLIPVGILGGLSIIFFTRMSLKWIFDITSRQFFIPAVLIVLGLIVIFKGSARKKDY